MTVWSSATPYPDPMIYMFPNKRTLHLTSHTTTKCTNSCDVHMQGITICETLVTTTTTTTTTTRVS
ncbi:hypothetical protein LINPERHAP1_LOCUS20748 [Linum perenne]